MSVASRTPFDHPSVSGLAAATPRNKHHSHKSHEQNLGQGFKLAYQKVTLDIDLAENSINGETELTILPLEQSLKEIKLDCRNIQIKSVSINGRDCQFLYNDFSQNNEYMNDTENPILKDYTYNPHFDSNSENISINQHHLYRGKFYPLYTDMNISNEKLLNEKPETRLKDSSNVLNLENTKELIIPIPDGISLKSYDPSSVAPPGSTRPPFSPLTINTARSNNTPVGTTTNMATSSLYSDKVYTPLNFKITYTIKNPKNGILFYGGKHTNIPKNRWFCYTVNNDFNCSASSWVPCVDNFYEKPAWDINIVVPKTIADIGEEKIIGTKKAELALKKLHAKLNATKDDDDDDNNNNGDSINEVKDNNLNDDDNDNDENIDESIPIVVAVPDLVSSKELPHNMDIGKKLVNFQFYNPVSPQHIGFAVGAFEKCPIMEADPETGKLVSSKDTLNKVNYDPTDFSVNDVDVASTNKVPTMFYYLPGDKDRVINSTIFLYRALEFYAKEFGSFPFNSYTMVFLDDVPCESTLGFAGLTIVNSKLLYSPQSIEPIFNTTESLSIALAEQYLGINVLPKSLNDIWCTIGLSRFMAGQFLKKLYGWNSYKFQIKERSELVCELDVGRRPLANQFFRFPVNSDQDFDFIKLKAPLVLFILDRRMTKTDKSFGLSRVIPKIFLQAMSGDLYNGNCLSTSHFQHVCEKVAHNKLEQFFENWVFNTGTPVFRVTQRFNKKRMFVEMSIRQVQKSDQSDSSATDMETSDLNRMNIRNSYQKENFIDEASSVLADENDYKSQPVFTGPITIRIHEADGTPYEHIVDIKDSFTRLDIQYNTKYRRTKRTRRDGTEANENEEKNGESLTANNTANKDTKESNLGGRLGDVLMSAKDVENWKIVESEPKEDETINDAFEWIRVDADFEWLCKVYINQPDYMFESQLYQDRDVEAQYDSIKFFSDSLRPSQYYSTILLRTLMDKRYYYGIRMEAAKGLAILSKEESGHLGLRYLLQAFKFFYCYYGEKINLSFNLYDPIEYLPLPNDFTSIPEYFLKKCLIESLSKIKNKTGDTPKELKRVLINLLKYNDNSNNQFSDVDYVSCIINSISNLLVNYGKPIPTPEELISEPDENTKLLRECHVELDRCLKMDGWLSESDHEITRAVLKEKIRLASLGLISITFQDFLKYTTVDNNYETRLLAFEGLLCLGGLKNAAILNLFFTVIKIEPSTFFKYSLLRVFSKCIGIAAMEGTPSVLDDDEFIRQYAGTNTNNVFANGGSGVISVSNGSVGNGAGIEGDRATSNIGSAIIVEESTSKGSMESRRDRIARSTIKGAIALLRRDYSIGIGLKNELWSALHSCLFSINSRRNFLDITALLYESRDSFIVKLDNPTDKKLIVKVDKELQPVPSIEEISNNINELEGKIVVTVKRQGRLKIQLPTIKTKLVLSTNMNSNTTGNKTVLKLRQPAEPKSDSLNNGSLSRSSSSTRLHLTTSSSSASLLSSSSLTTAGTNVSNSASLVPGNGDSSSASGDLKVKTESLEVNIPAAGKKSTGVTSSSLKFTLLDNKKNGSKKTSSAREKHKIKLEDTPIADPFTIPIDREIVKINQTKSKFLITLNFSDKSLLKNEPYKPSNIYKSAKVKSEIIRKRVNSPLRYVRLNIFEKKVTISSESLFENDKSGTQQPSAANANTRDNHSSKSYPITLKVSSKNLRMLESIRESSLRAKGASNKVILNTRGVNKSSAGSASTRRGHIHGNLNSTPSSPSSSSSSPNRMPSLSHSPSPVPSLNAKLDSVPPKQSLPKISFKRKVSPVADLSENISNEPNRKRKTINLSLNGSKVTSSEPSLEGRPRVKLSTKDHSKSSSDSDYMSSQDKKKKGNSSSAPKIKLKLK
ncbi:binding protein [[Candida] boidinii]|nr:binding protein [[Candida] boidinii]